MCLFKKKRYFEKIDDKGVIPTRADDDSCGYDIFLTENITLKPGETKFTPTHIKAIFPSNEVMLLFIRSSIGTKRDISIKNQVGVIDSGTSTCLVGSGEIIIPLYNYGSSPQTFKKGERIAQGVFLKYYKVSGEKRTYKKRIGTFGSSGR